MCEWCERLPSLETMIAKAGFPVANISNVHGSGGSEQPIKKMNDYDGPSLVCSHWRTTSLQNVINIVICEEHVDIGLEKRMINALGLNAAKPQTIHK